MSRRDELRELLDAYSPSPGEEHHHRRMLELLDAPADVLSRDHFEPGHFTASAFVVSLDRTQLVLVDHRRLQRWLQPGGHVEPEDDSVLAAARREVVEEVGIEARLLAPLVFDIDVHDIPARVPEPDHVHFDVRFAFEAEASELTAGAEVNGAAWVPLRDIANYTSDASVIRAAQKIGYLR